MTAHVVPTYSEMIKHHRNDWSREDDIFCAITDGIALETEKHLPEHLVVNNTKSKRWRLSKTLSIIIPVTTERGGD